MTAAGLHQDGTAGIDEGRMMRGDMPLDCFFAWKECRKNKDQPEPPRFVHFGPSASIEQPSIHYLACKMLSSQLILIYNHASTDKPRSTTET